MDFLKKLLSKVKALWPERKWTIIGAGVLVVGGAAVLVHDAVTHEESILEQVPEVSCGVVADAEEDTD